MDALCIYVGSTTPIPSFLCSSQGQETQSHDARSYRT